MPVYRLTDDLAFPSPEEADEDGLLAVGGDLRPERLLLAYSMGIFPWPHEGYPLLWFSPDPRMVLGHEGIHVSRRLRRTVRTGKFRPDALRSAAGQPDRVIDSFASIDEVFGEPTTHR